MALQATDIREAEKKRLGQVTIQDKPMRATMEKARNAGIKRASDRK